MESKELRAREIQKSIREVLLRDWDPIGVSDVHEANDEYESYVGRVYRLLASQGSTEDIVDLLYEVETQWMGLTPDRESLRKVAVKLRELDVSL